MLLFPVSSGIRIPNDSAYWGQLPGLKIQQEKEHLERNSVAKYWRGIPVKGTFPMGESAGVWGEETGLLHLFLFHSSSKHLVIKVWCKYFKWIPHFFLSFMLLVLKSTGC